MEERKLTKADIDKVRHIEGFPIGKDEDIIALSRPPYYTACPNPFIEDFIRENGTPYDEATDDYHREPFAADVSEGKNDPIYNAHSYHTKVPHKAIMRYILHYTKPGDIVFDGFCGTGMTGVAAQMCGCPDTQYKMEIEAEMEGENIQWGVRKALISDLAPAATFIAYNYNTPVDVVEYIANIHSILEKVNKQIGWMYETHHVDENGQTICGLDGTPQCGTINFTLWSDVFVCPSCSNEFIFWDVAIDRKNSKVLENFTCPHCQCRLSKHDCEHAIETKYDILLGNVHSIIKQVPVLINYSIGKKRYEKRPDENDFSVLARINDYGIHEWVPNDRMPEGDESRRNDKYGITHVHHFYHRSALIAMSMIWKYAVELEDKDIGLHIMFAHTAANNYLSKMRRYRADKKGGGPLSGTLYISSLITPPNPMLTIARNAENICSALQVASFERGNAIISTQSLGDMLNVPENSIDYIFTDPPFGGNLNYSDLNFLWEAWLKVKTASESEAIVSRVHRKNIQEYQQMLEKCFVQYYRVLKPNRWITVEFHNSQNAVWNAITEALSRAGFVVADVRVLDKKQGSFKQITATAAVKQDLVISAYKPKESFVREFQQRAGDPEMVWKFVRQHLRNVPVVADGNHDGKLDIIAERQDYLLFDRMVAWHIMNGIPVPMDAHTFYDGLRQRFLERDGMFFLPDQVNEYDDKRAHMELDTAQLSFIVTDEKNAIQWLNYILAQGPMTYQKIQPLYMQELHQSRQEKMPELMDMLKENFVQDEKGAWYVPDLTNAADLAKVRRKALLKEFWDSCATGKGKLKVFRMEAIRAGFDECWKTRDFKTIVAVGERLPEAVLQEDPALLMYYDNACSRV